MEEKREENREIKKEPIKITIQRLPASEIGYSKTIEELKVYCKERAERIKNGEKQLATLDFAMLAYGLDCVEWAKKSFQLDLDLGEGSLLQFQTILENTAQAIKKGALPKERLDSFLKMFTGFYGMLILRNIGGAWVQSSVGPAIEAAGRPVFVMNCIIKFLNTGTEGESCIGFYGKFKDLCRQAQ